MRRVLLSLVLCAPLFLGAQEPTVEHRAPEIPSIVGRWDSQLTPAQGSGDAVDFTIAIQVVQRDLRADLLNGPSRMTFSRIEWTEPNLTLRLDQYDGVITAHCADKVCDALTGKYTRPRGSETVEFKFSARRHPIELQHSPVAWQWPTIEGDWRFTFETPENDPEHVARAHFVQGPAEGGANEDADAEVNGTVAPVSGDFGLMHGTIVIEGQKQGHSPRFHLSRFDGIHAIVLKGAFLSETRVTGTISFSFAKPIAFTGERLSKAPEPTGTPALPNPETLTTVKDPAQPFHFSGIDLQTGQEITSDDPRFKGKAVIIDIFGTWCPNCHDEAPLLSDLYNRYHAKGLEIVGLSYEYTADRARSSRLLKLYRDTYTIEFPLLIAGTTDSGQIAKTLPQLKDFAAYPTTIFLDKTGKVHAIHAGFAGPATGNFEEVKARFEKLIEEILK